MEERLIEEEIDKGMFDKYRSKFRHDKTEIEKHLAANGNKVSNLEKSLDAVINYAAKLNTMWDSADHNQKQQLQSLVFPDGMYYNRKKDECRTERVNTIFLCISELVGTSDKRKAGIIAIKLSFPP